MASRTRARELPRAAHHHIAVDSAGDDSWARGHRRARQRQQQGARGGCTAPATDTISRQVPQWAILRPDDRARGLPLAARGRRGWARSGNAAKSARSGSGRREPSTHKSTGCGRFCSVMGAVTGPGAAPSPGWLRVCTGRPCPRQPRPRIPRRIRPIAACPRSARRHRPLPPPLPHRRQALADIR